MIRRDGSVDPASIRLQTSSGSLFVRSAGDRSGRGRRERQGVRRAAVGVPGRHPSHHFPIFTHAREMTRRHRAVLRDSLRACGCGSSRRAGAGHQLQMGAAERRLRSAPRQGLDRRVADRWRLRRLGSEHHPARSRLQRSLLGDLDRQRRPERAQGDRGRGRAQLPAVCAPHGRGGRPDRSGRHRAPRGAPRRGRRQGDQRQRVPALRRRAWPGLAVGSPPGVGRDRALDHRRARDRGDAHRVRSRHVDAHRRLRRRRRDHGADRRGKRESRVESRRDA